MSSAAEHIPRQARPGTRTVVVAGTPLRVAIRPGTGAGPPLLLANGIGASLETLQPFVDALEPAITAIRFDVPGVGGSPPPARPYRFATLAWLLRGLLSKLGYQSADILGISWGGGLAQQFALSSPLRCRRLILVATATGPQTMVPGNPLVLTKMLSQRRYLDPDYARRIAGGLYGGSARTDADTITGILRQERACPLRGYLYQHAAGLGWTSLPFLRLIRQPTLVLAGNDDPIIPLANAKILAALIPSARLHVYNGGHLELVTRPTCSRPWSPVSWPRAARAKPHPCPDTAPDSTSEADGGVATRRFLWKIDGLSPHSTVPSVVRESHAGPAGQRDDEPRSSSCRLNRALCSVMIASRPPSPPRSGRARRP